jgi:hypothetical protein
MILKRVLINMLRCLELDLYDSGWEKNDKFLYVR